MTTADQRATLPLWLTWFRDAATQAMRDVRSSGNQQAIDVGDRLVNAINALTVDSEIDDVEARAADYTRAVALLTQQRWRHAAPSIQAAVPPWPGDGTAVEFLDPEGWPATLTAAMHVLPITDPMRLAIQDWTAEFERGFRAPEGGILSTLAGQSSELQELWRQRMGRLLGFASRYLQGYAQANRAVNAATGNATPGHEADAPRPSSNKGLIIGIGALAFAAWLFKSD